MEIGIGFEYFISSVGAARGAYGIIVCPQGFMAFIDAENSYKKHSSQLLHFEFGGISPIIYSLHRKFHIIYYKNYPRAKVKTRPRTMNTGKAEFIWKKLHVKCDYDKIISVRI